MATTSLNREETAKALGVSTRTLHTYVKQGLISVTRQGRQQLYAAAEVEEFRLALQEVNKRAVVTPKELALLTARLSRVEAELSALLRILDAKNDPLRMNNAYARDLFTAARAQMQSGAWSVAEMNPWAEVFLRIDEEDFRVLMEAVEDPKPWKIFLRLCVAMTNRIVTMDEYLTTPDVQALHRRLVEGRRRMRIAAMIFMELYNTAQDSDLRKYIFTDIPNSIGDTLTNILKHKKKKA